MLSTEHQKRQLGMCSSCFGSLFPGEMQRVLSQWLQSYPKPLCGISPSRLPKAARTCNTSIKASCGGVARANVWWESPFQVTDFHNLTRWCSTNSTAKSGSVKLEFHFFSIQRSLVFPSDGDHDPSWFRNTSPGHDFSPRSTRDRIHRILPVRRHPTDVYSSRTGKNHRFFKM